MRKQAGWIAVILCMGWGFPSSICRAQASAQYQNEEHVFNGGGNPSPTLSSANYQIGLSSIGDSLALGGLTSSSYTLDGGLIPPNRPPGEVRNLRFVSKTSMEWDPEPSVGTYQVYRGNVGDWPGSYGSCLLSGVTVPGGSDAQVPASGQGYFYLVTAANRLSEEGTMGKDSGGTPRGNGAPCP